MVKATEAVELGDVVMIACPKCKTMAYSVAEADKAGPVKLKTLAEDCKEHGRRGSIANRLRGVRQRLVLLCYQAGG